ncbi:hypothetical protein [Okeania sp. SIO2C2]|uniref:hypothetical protein n=1 Tax=Okeania sp. SIO2C2 TaxID=2607787 RepID=UPI00257B94D6|nr:hypothetical protein [Okeania sp. SIO2C2]
MESLMGEGRRQETGDNPPLTPPRRGEMGISEEVGVTIVNLGFFCTLEEGKQKAESRR